MLTVSMYTPNTPYEKEVEKLIKSLEKYGVEYIVVPIGNSGSWALNCGQNARVIYEIMKRYEDDILLLDADSEVVSYPALFENIDCDIAIHRIKYPDRDRLEYCTGTLFCKENDRVKSFLREWSKMNSVSPDDQINFMNVYEKSIIQLYDLPKEYCYIEGNRVHRHGACKPVIVHHQASRRLKEVINAE